MNPGLRDRAEAVARGELSVVELTEAALAAIAERDPEVRAFTGVDAAGARAAARQVRAGPLAGALVGVKELIAVAGLETGYGTPALATARAPADAVCVRRLRAAGAVVLGTTRTSQLAWLPDTPPTVNPRFPGVSPGGSSGGSAAAVAAGLADIALGTDTGGSIRSPAAHCGLVGLKPTYGVVPVAGVLPTAWTLDTVGPLAATVDDARLALAALTGREPGRPLPHDLAGIRLGAPPLTIADPSAGAAHAAALVALERGGATIVPLELPLARLAAPIVTAISLGDAAAYHDYPAGAGEFPEELRAQLQLARVLPAAVAVRAQQARRALIREVAAAMTTGAIDAIVLPGRLEAAASWGSRAWYLASATGQPAIVLPLTPVAGVPNALQLVGRPYGDERLLDLAEAAVQVV